MAKTKQQKSKREGTTFKVNPLGIVERGVTSTQKDTLATIISLVTASLGLVAALAWNEAIKAAVNEYLPKGQGILGLFMYAVVISVLTVLVIRWLQSVKNRVGGRDVRKAKK